MVDVDALRSAPPATPARKPAAPTASPHRLRRLNALIVRHTSATLLLEAAVRRERDPVVAHGYRARIARHEQRLSQLQREVQRHGGTPARIGAVRRAWCTLRIAAASLRGRPRLLALLQARHAI